MKVYYKNVHQGDSIVLEWKGIGRSTQCGIIDCTLDKHHTNPVVKHLKNNSKIKKIKFVILTHPHTDHFSGLLELFKYCENNEIIIENFYHTSLFDPDYLKALGYTSKMQEDILTYSAKGVVAKAKVKRLYEVMSHFANNPDKSIIRNFDLIVNKDQIINLTSKIRLRAIAPIHNKEIRKYILSMMDDDSQSKEVSLKKNSNTKANLLSTLFLLEMPGSKIMFTSDCTNFVFERLLGSDDDFRSVSLCQIPHHGSENNFLEHFWKAKTDISSTLFVISAGDKYKHPSYEVVKYFDGAQELHCTNYVNGFQEYYNEIKPNYKSINKVKLEMDTADDGPNIDDLYDCGEKLFIIENGKIEVVTNPFS